MNKLFACLAASMALCGPLPVLAQPEAPAHSLAAMGCMKLGECTEGVTEVKSLADLKAVFGDDWLDKYSEFDFEEEIEAIFKSFAEVNVKVYVATDNNFPVTHRGAYYTDVNKMFLNTRWVDDPIVFMKVFRHEGWHAAQDCMAGSIDNTYIAVIHNEEIIPREWVLSAEIRYGMLQPKAIPWEQEAIWAGNVPDMTADALQSCTTGAMWNDYEPTPLTREWLELNGHL